MQHSIQMEELKSKFAAAGGDWEKFKEFCKNIVNTMKQAWENVKSVFSSLWQQYIREKPPRLRKKNFCSYLHHRFNSYHHLQKMSKRDLRTIHRPFTITHQKVIPKN